MQSTHKVVFITNDTYHKDAFQGGISISAILPP